MRTLGNNLGFNRLREEMDRLFGSLVPTQPNSWFDVAAYPPVNVWENGEAIFVEAEVPGLALEDLELSVHGDALTIGGERKVPVTEAAYHRRERGNGKFRRVLRLPVPIDQDKIDASLKEGVLLLTLPKAPEARPRKIAVKYN